jgi:hypothetical protein
MSGEPKERPILFSGPMVRAILDGRKTQTRRVVTKQTSELGSAKWEWIDLDAAWTDMLWGVIPGLKVPTSKAPPEYCPECVTRLYPRIFTGDRLWVRETHWINEDEGTAAYRADGEMPRHMQGARWRPSIHMPRWASRITLEVTEVRVERVQEITGGDAIAEGLSVVDEVLGLPVYDCGPMEIGGVMGDAACTDPCEAFMHLWDTLNAKRGHGWDMNPWVWVVNFREVAR